MSYIGKTRDPAFQFYADQTTLDLAKGLRRNMTPSEKALWQRLRSNKIAGLKFRRQHPVKYYIADFYCHEARLVIEVDGPIHDRIDRREHDQQRNGVMEEFGKAPPSPPRGGPGRGQYRLNMNLCIGISHNH
jgi:very-short-patch-repair endonuclease